jgi:hypothetical protein
VCCEGEADEWCGCDNTLSAVPKIVQTWEWNQNLFVFWSIREDVKSSGILSQHWVLPSHIMKSSEARAKCWIIRIPTISTSVWAVSSRNAFPKESTTLYYPNISWTPCKACDQKPRTVVQIVECEVMPFMSSTACITGDEKRKTNSILWPRKSVSDVVRLVQGSLRASSLIVKTIDRSALTFECEYHLEMISSL